MLIDNHISQLLSGIFSDNLMPDAHLFLIVLMYSVLKHRLTYLMILGIALGVIYDAYFLNVIGLAAAVIPLIALFCYEIQAVIFANRLTRLFTTVIVVFAFEVILPLVEVAFGLVTFNFLHFIASQLAPTLLLNILLAFLLQWPLEALYGIQKTDEGYEIKN